MRAELGKAARTPEEHSPGAMDKVVSACGAEGQATETELAGNCSLRRDTASPGQPTEMAPE